MKANWKKSIIAGIVVGVIVGIFTILIYGIGVGMTIGFSVMLFSAYGMFTGLDINKGKRFSIFFTIIVCLFGLLGIWASNHNYYSYALSMFLIGLLSFAGGLVAVIISLFGVFTGIIKVD